MALISISETYVHNCSSANGLPRIVFNYMLEVVASSFCIRIHGVSKTFGAFRIPWKLFINSFLGAVGNGKSLFWHRVKTKAQLASQKKRKGIQTVWFGSWDPGYLIMALTVWDAACHSSFVLVATQSRIWGSSARSLDAAVWATIPLRGSLKICLVMAWRRIRRTSGSFKPHAVAIWANEDSSWIGKVDAIFRWLIACMLRSSSCLGKYFQPLLHVGLVLPSAIYIP